MRLGALGHEVFDWHTLSADLISPERMKRDERRRAARRLNPTVGMILLELQAFNQAECARRGARATRRQWPRCHGARWVQRPLTTATSEINNRMI